MIMEIRNKNKNTKIQIFDVDLPDGKCVPVVFLVYGAPWKPQRKRGTRQSLFFFLFVSIITKKIPDGNEEELVSHLGLRLNND